MLASAFIVTFTLLPAQPQAPDLHLIAAPRDQNGLALTSSSCISLSPLSFYSLPLATWFFFHILEFLFFPTPGISLLLLFSSFKKFIHWISGRVVG